MDRQPCARRGFFLPLLILGMVSVAFLGATLHFLGSSYSTQVQHVDESSRALMIAESVLAKVAAEIRERPFSQRAFRGAPLQQMGQTLLGGTYDLFVENAPSPWARHYDVYVRVACGRARRLYFWRVRHEESVLDSVGRILPVLFCHLDPDRFPTGSVSPFAATIRDLIAARQANEDRATDRAAAILQEDSLPVIIAAAHTYPPGQPPKVLEPPAGLPPMASPPATPPPPPPVVATPPGTLPGYHAHFTTPAPDYPGTKWPGLDQIAVKLTFLRVPLGQSNVQFVYRRYDPAAGAGQKDTADADFPPIPSMPGLWRDQDPYDKIFPRGEGWGEVIKADPVEKDNFYPIRDRFSGLRDPDSPTQTIP